MSGDERRFHGRNEPFLVRLWEGEVNPAMPWPAALAERAASSVEVLCPCHGCTLTITRQVAQASIVITQGATVQAIYCVPGGLPPGFMLRLHV